MFLGLNVIIWFWGKVFFGVNTFWKRSVEEGRELGFGCVGEEGSQVGEEALAGFGG